MSPESMWTLFGVFAVLNLALNFLILRQLGTRFRHVKERARYWKRRRRELAEDMVRMVLWMMHGESAQEMVAHWSAERIEDFAKAFARRAAQEHELDEDVKVELEDDVREALNAYQRQARSQLLIRVH